MYNFPTCIAILSLASLGTCTPATQTAAAGRSFNIPPPNLDIPISNISAQSSNLTAYSPPIRIPNTPYTIAFDTLPQAIADHSALSLFLFRTIASVSLTLIIDGDGPVPEEIWVERKSDFAVWIDRIDANGAQLTWGLIKEVLVAVKEWVIVGGRWMEVYATVKEDGVGSRCGVLLRSVADYDGAEVIGVSQGR